MYVKKIIESKSPEKLALYLPINQVLRTLKKYEPAFVDSFDVNTLSNVIKHYLSSLDIKITSHDLHSILSKKDTILIIDGLDEAISAYPNLISVLNDFALRYHDCQIITSSRMSEDYISHIEFLSVTLKVTILNGCPREDRILLATQ